MTQKTVTSVFAAGLSAGGQRLRTAALMLLVSGSCWAIHAPIAKAGVFSWLDQMTTYNEDQKRPFKKPYEGPPSPPAPLMYDAKEGATWSHYYTRGDLTPTDYIDGSASKVMRQDPQAAIAAARMDMGRSDPANPNGYLYDANGHVVMGPDGRPVTGYGALNRRNMMNSAQNNPNSRVFIGDPGTMAMNDGAAGRIGAPSGYGRGYDNGYSAGDSRYADNGEVGAKTKIGKPINDWRSDAPYPQPHITPQPGDFDYRGNAANGGRGLTVYNDLPQQGGRQLAPSGQHYAAGAGNSRVPGMPDNYTVQKGDTLSGISNKDQIYGDWKMWPLIYDANRSQITDPDLVYPNQQLGIPRDYTMKDADQARQRANEKSPPYLFHDNR